MSVSTELYTFVLEAFDYDVKNKKWQSAMIFRASAILTLGVVKILFGFLHPLYLGLIAMVW